MLHYLQAFAYLKGSRMRAEAAHQIELASKLPYGPPFPWRTIEREALGELAIAFQSEAAIQNLITMLSEGSTDH
jgi:hypothetical protein